MKRIRLVFGTHNSQAVGESDSVYERVYQRAYKPFLAVLNRFPEISAVLHYSGTLLEWFERRHPELLMLLAEMVKRRQVELLTGGFYEPVLPLIPNPDRLGQIEKLTTYLRTHFGRRSRGSWLAERVWDPTLASGLSTGGIEYTFVTEHHFRAVGIEGGDLFHPYLTEDLSKSVVVYPLCETLAAMLGAGEPEQMVAALTAAADTEGRRVICVIADGEKLGDMGESHRILYEEKWMERFLGLLVEQESVVGTVLPGTELRGTHPRAKLYFPTTSYAQLMSWLPECLEGRGAAASGATFRQALSLYSESNLIYARMMYTHLLVNQIRGDKVRRRAAREELWRGQCASAYRHGPTGGVYANRLRKTAYRAFLEAEKITRDNNGMFLPSINAVDFDLDGTKEYLHLGPIINVFVHRIGGTVFELDFLPSCWNFADTFTRVPESYHRPQDRIYDRYPRRLFVDHFLSPKVRLADFARMEHEELGDFPGREYELQELDREHRELSLISEGTVAGAPVVISKRYRFKKSTIYVRYGLENRGEEPLSVRFASELNLAFADGTPDELRISVDDERQSGEISLEPTELEDVSAVEMRDLVNHVALRLKCDREFGLWSLPVRTVYRTAVEWRSEYQSTCLIPGWELTLKPDEEWRVELALNITRQ